MTYKGRICLTGKRSAVQICQSSQKNSVLIISRLGWCQRTIFVCVRSEMCRQTWVHLGIFGYMWVHFFANPWQTIKS